MSQRRSYFSLHHGFVTLTEPSPVEVSTMAKKRGWWWWVNLGVTLRALHQSGQLKADAQAAYSMLQSLRLSFADDPRIKQLVELYQKYAALVSPFEP